jgi:cytochrome c peroxidase
MKRKLKFIVALSLMLILYAFHCEQQIDFPRPGHFPEPVYDFSKNPLTAPKIELGRHLFYEPLLSRDTSISCSSCHSQYTAFTHVDHDLSHGIDDRIGTRNTPSLMNLAWGKLFMWDGAVNHLDMQALAPISHEDEMGDDINNVIIKLEHSEKYIKLFANAFGDNQITGERLLKAISQFELSLISANSKYDQVKNQTAEFNEQEVSGYQLFEKNCNSCHQEPLFTTQEFASNGLPEDADLKDLGRYTISKNPKDSFFFKIPTLRNVEFSYPYMHDGRFNTLYEVLNHYTATAGQTKYIDKRLQAALILSENEKVDLVAFLLTLTDKTFLFNPNFSYPRSY